MQVITTHLNADFDGLASMIAVQKLHPDAVMAFPGSQEKKCTVALLQKAYPHKYTFEKLKNIDLKLVNTLIVVDTRQKSRIGDFGKCLQNPDLKLYLYDHHPDNEDDLKGDFESVAQVGATATLVSDILHKKTSQSARKKPPFSDLESTKTPALLPI